MIELAAFLIVVWLLPYAILAGLAVLAWILLVPFMVAETLCDWIAPLTGRPGP